ncbi:mechanosensitive ion channel protein MscS [Candidatus Pacearchaeota archaeon CG10_big_fil_rev_8_21_14_0_10_31_24]|nr:MAG: mechanosensitive ion channel protein MscS [Candidatus Pacearchaeota archaeon CG10_big_fil_rev_8_21_14_0_10_31_24]
MVSVQEILDFTFLGNSGNAYGLALLIFIGSLIVMYLFKTYAVALLHNASKKSKLEMDDMLADGIASLHSPFYLYLSFYLATYYLVLPEKLSHTLWVILLIFIVYYTGKFLQGMVKHYAHKEIEKRKSKDSQQGSSLLQVLSNFVSIAVWLMGLLFILTNIGVKITPLIAGLGVGGIAIAFALQTVLEDVFSAFSIYFDKPFKEGDFIIVGADMGVVQHIGLKTTRIQTLQGQELVISNRELTSTRINNYKKMRKRRISFNFGVEYGTPTKKLKKIKTIVSDIIKKEKLTTLDRVHFKSFGESSLDYEVVYYIDSSDYNIYMDTQENINLSIKDAFEKEGINMTFPTRTIYMAK